jgi:hypothetical protein
MFNIQTKKIGKTNKGNLEYIKRRIVEHRDAGYCDSEGRTIERHDTKTGRGLGPQKHAGKGDRDRCRHDYDLKDLYRLAARNLWPRDNNGNLIEGDD